MLMKICTGYWNNQLERMDMKVEEDNGISAGMVNGRAWKVRQFSSNEFWKKIGCLISAPNFGLAGSRMWEK